MTASVRRLWIELANRSPVIVTLGSSFAVGLVAGLVGARLQVDRLRVQRRADLETVAERVDAEVRSRVSRYQYGLRGARGVVEATWPHLSRERFRTYMANRLGLSLDDPDGAWTVELKGPNQLIHEGWTRTVLKVGDKVTMFVNPLHNRVLLSDGSSGARYVGVVLADGKMLGQTDGAWLQ